MNQLLQSLLYQAVKVIKTKAPSKHKTQVAFMTTQSAVKVRKEEKKKKAKEEKITLTLSTSYHTVVCICCCFTNVTAPSLFVRL